MKYANLTCDASEPMAGGGVRVGVGVVVVGGGLGWGGGGWMGVGDVGGGWVWGVGGWMGVGGCGGGDHNYCSKHPGDQLTFSIVMPMWWYFYSAILFGVVWTKFIAIIYNVM